MASNTINRKFIPQTLQQGAGLEGDGHIVGTETGDYWLPQVKGSGGLPDQYNIAWGVSVAVVEKTAVH